jgi:hypothetical protein
MTAIGLVGASVVARPGNAAALKPIINQLEWGAAHGAILGIAAA